MTDPISFAWFHCNSEFYRLPFYFLSPSFVCFFFLKTSFLITFSHVVFRPPDRLLLLIIDCCNWLLHVDRGIDFCDFWIPLRLAPFFTPSLHLPSTINPIPDLLPSQCWFYLCDPERHFLLASTLLLQQRGHFIARFQHSSLSEMTDLQDLGQISTLQDGDLLQKHTFLANIALYID